MSTDPFDDIMKRFDGLSPEERQELIHQLERRQRTAPNGNSDRTLLDAFQDHGMVGSITDAPEDWSVNPKYMEGFGSGGQ